MKIKINIPVPQKTKDGYKIPHLSPIRPLLEGWTTLKDGNKYAYMVPPADWQWVREVEVPSEEQARELADYVYENLNHGGWDSDTTLEWIIEEMTDQSEAGLCPRPKKPKKKFPDFPLCTVDLSSDDNDNPVLTISLGAESDDPIWAIRFEWDGQMATPTSFSEKGGKIVVKPATPTPPKVTYFNKNVVQ